MSNEKLSKTKHLQKVEENAWECVFAKISEFEKRIQQLETDQIR